MKSTLCFIAILTAIPARPAQTAAAATAPASPYTATTVTARSAVPTTGPATRAADAAATSTDALVTDPDLSTFFPRDIRDCNAGAAYTQAIEYFRADSGRIQMAYQWDALLDRPIIQRALAHVTSGTHCRVCNLIPYLPDDLSRRTKFPYLLDTQAFAKLLSARIDRQLKAKERGEALQTAREMMALGRHLRQSAMVLSQDIQGIAIERLAVSEFRKIYGPQADRETSAKLKAVEWILDRNQNFIAQQVSSHTATGGFSADRAWLQSPYPVLRCEAILNMAQNTFPPKVLLKPTPPLSIKTVMEKRALTTTDTIPLREDAFPEHDIDWPRKGVLGSVYPEDARAARALLEPMAKNDPDERVRVLAQRFLDSLIIPAPTPPPPADLPTTGGRVIPPPPRPPAGMPPPGMRPGTMPPRRTPPRSRQVPTPARQYPGPLLTPYNAPGVR